MSAIQEIENLDRAIKKMQMRIVYNEHQDLDLHPGQLLIVRLLAFSGKTNQSELAKKANVSNACAGTSVRRLERIGLVRRGPDESDLRSVCVELTDKGKAYADSINKYFVRLSGVKYRGFSGEDLTRYKALLKQIHDNFEQYYIELEGNRD